MEDELKFKDLKVFIRDNQKLFILYMLIPIVLTVVFFLVNPINTQESIIDTEVSLEDNQDLISIRERWSDSDNEFTSDEKDLIDELILESSHYFEIYVENERYQPITNAYLIKNLLISDKTLETLNYDFIDLPSPDFMVTVQSINDSGIHRITVGTGEENSSENLSKVYYNALENNEIDILADKRIDFLSDVSRTTEDQEEEIYEDTEGIIDPDVESIDTRDLILMILIALFISFVSGVAALIIKLLFTDRISSLYNLRNNKKDKVIRMTHLSKFSLEETVDFLHSSILFSSNDNIVILTERNTCEKILSELFSKKRLVERENIVLLNNFSQTVDKLAADEVIVCIEKDKTSKEWYRKQRMQLKMLDVDIKVILL